MTPWQVLRASGAIQAALGYRVHHGGSVHYSTAAAAAPDGSRSFCLSSEKLSMQQLNSRLASYLQQVQCLEMANQELEFLIQKELDRKCPHELRELDGPLRTVSLLQEQISGCLSAQAEVKLQLLNAELTVHNLSIRHEKEQEHRCALEAKLSILRLLGEELQTHKLPELQIQLNDQMQHLMELHFQHQQDMQRLKTQMSAGFTVEMQPAPSLDLIQELDDLRQTTVTLLDQNQSDCWFNTQESILNSPEVTFDPPSGSEVIQAELEELRTRAASLEEELTQLQAVNTMLEATGLEQNESIVQELVALQQRADGLCSDLDSVLQATAQQAADYQTLLDVKTRLETEIQDYRRLLDGPSPQGLSRLHPNSTANVSSFCVTTNPSVLRTRDLKVNKTANVQEGNIRSMEFHAVSRGHMHTVGQTPEVASLSATVTTVQSISEHPKNSPVTLINASNLTDLLQKSENQKPGTLPKNSGRESKTISVIKHRQSTTMEGKVPAEDQDLQNSSIVSNHISRSLDKGAVVESNTALGVTPLVPDTQSIMSAEGGLQVFTRGTIIQTAMTKTSPCAEPEVKQGTHLIIDTSKQPPAEVKKETETVIATQMTCTEGSMQAKNQDPAHVVSLSLETTTEAVRDGEKVEFTASLLSGSHILRTNQAQNMVSGESNKEKQVVKVESASHVLMSDQKAALSNASSSQQITVMADAHTGSNIATASSGTPEINGNLEIKTAKETTTLVPDAESFRGAAVQAKPGTPTITEAGLQASKTETNIRTVTTKTIICAEPEVMQGTPFITYTTTDSSKKTAAEVKKETETVIAAQMTCTEGSMQAKNQDPAQVVSLSLETTTEAVKDAEEVAITASVASGSNILTSEEAQTKVSGELNLMDDKNTEIKEKKEGNRVVEVESTLRVLRLDQSAALPNASSREQIRVMEDAQTGSNIATSSSGSPDSNDNKAAQGNTTLVPETQPVRSDAVQSKPETQTSKPTTTEAGLQANEAETVITKSILCAGPEVEQVTHFGKHTTITDSRKETATEIKNETETVIAAQMKCTEGSMQAKNQDSAHAVSFSLETTTEDVRDAEEVAITASVVSGSNIPTSEEAQAKVSGDLNIMDDSNIKNNEKMEGKEVVDIESASHVLRLDQSAASPNLSSREQIKVLEDTHTGSNIATASSGSPDSNDNKAAQGDITLFPEIQSVRNDAVQAKQETLTSKQTTTEAGLPANETETNIQTVITKNILCVEPELEQATHFEKHTTITDSRRQKPAEVKKETENVIAAQMTCTEGSMQAKNQDPAQVVSLSLETTTEAVRDAEEIEITASFDSGSSIPRSEEAQAKVSGEASLMDDKDIERQENKGEEEVEGTLPVCRLDQTLELSSASNSEQNTVMGDAHTGSDTVSASSSRTDSNENFKSKASQDIITLFPEIQPVRSDVVQAKTKTLTSKTNAAETGLQAKEKETNSPAVITKTILCAEPELGKATHSVKHSVITDSRKETAAKGKNQTETVIAAQVTCTEGSMQAKNQDLTQVVSLNLQTNSSKPNRLDHISASSTAFSSKEKVTEDADTRSGTATASYNGSNLGHTSMSLPNIGNKESPSEALLDSTSHQGTKRFNNRESGEWRVYGDCVVQKSSLDSITSLHSKGKEDSPSVATNSATGTPVPGRFGSDRSEDWIVYSGSLGRKSSLRRARSEESQAAAMLPATSLTEIRRLAGGGSGSLTRTSSLAGGDSLASAAKEAFLSVAVQKASSTPESLGGGRFGSGGSGEWRVYGGSTGKSSSAGSTERVSDHKISQPRSNISGAGSVVRRSSSAGSGGGLSSSSSGGRVSSQSSSQRISTSGKFTSTGSGEGKPVYSSATARKSSVGSGGRSGGGGTISSQRAPNSGGRMIVSMGSGGWLSSSTAGVSSTGSGSKLSSSGGSDRISGRAGGKISISSGSVRTNSAGGRVISSSDRPIRSTGSGAGGNKERISVCKMAALSISAAGRERNQERQKQAQRPQQQQQSGATSPLLQRWLTTGVRIKSSDPEPLDDITRH